MDKRSETSADNGKLGGRPVSEATIKAQLAREYIAEHVKQSLEPIVAKAINDAILGDDKARAWLSDRAWGKPIQALDVTSLGEKLSMSDEQFNQFIRAASSRSADSEGGK